MIDLIIERGKIDSYVTYFDTLNNEDIEISYKINWRTGSTKTQVFCQDSSFLDGDFGDKFDSDNIKAF